MPTSHSHGHAARFPRSEARVQPTCSGQRPGTAAARRAPARTHSETCARWQRPLRLTALCDRGQPGPSEGCPGKASGCPHAALPFGRDNPLYFGQEPERRRGHPGNPRRKAGRGSRRGRRSPELPGPHLQRSHSTPLGAADVTHDVVSNHDGLSRSEKHAEATSVFFLCRFVFFDIINCLIRGLKPPSYKLNKVTAASY